MDAKRVQTWFFGAIFLALFLAVGLVFSPFFSIILWSTLLYVLFSPLYHRIIDRVDTAKRWGKILRYLLSGAFSVMSVVIIVVPLGFIVVRLGIQTAALIRTGLDFLESNPEFLGNEVDAFSNLLRELSLGNVDVSSAELKRRIAGGLAGSVEIMIGFSTSIFKNIGVFLASLMFMVFTLFFFYMDGKYLLKLITRAIPIRLDYMSQLIRKFKEITQNLFLGYILVAVAQAIAGYFILLLFGVESPIALSVLILLCSFIPMLGTAIVWMPIGIAIIVSGGAQKGIFFLVVCAIFISSLDNILRPFFLKDRIKLHPLIIFFSIMGGLAAFGFNGLILGPMTVIFFITVLDLFLVEHGIMPEQ